jgi:hypothetical protein
MDDVQAQFPEGACQAPYQARVVSRPQPELENPAALVRDTTRKLARALQAEDAGEKLMAIETVDDIDDAVLEPSGTQAQQYVPHVYRLVPHWIHERRP